MDTASSEWTEPPVELGRFRRLADARELGLVLAAASIAYSIERENRDWLVRVDSSGFTKALEEWRIYQSANPKVSPPDVEEDVEDRAPVPQPSTGSLWAVACVMVGFAVVQAECEPAWREAGVLSSERVWGHGEWWRTLTALTLHADAQHLVANLATGLCFVRWLISAFGGGLAWFLVLLTGAVGNAVNVWCYFPGQYRSLGASTAVFGALGLLVGDAMGGFLRTRQGRSWWRWVLPLGAGTALLAYLGAGDGREGRVDVTAHLWGFLVGIPVGLLGGWYRVGRLLPGWFRLALGGGAAVLLAVAWSLALRAG